MEAPHLRLPAAFLTVPNLGAPLEVHRLSMGRLCIRIAACILLLAAAAPMPFLARIGLQGEHGLWYAVGGVLVVFALLLVWETYARARTTIVLYEEGLAQSDGGGLRAWRWDQIDAVTFEITRHSVNFIPTGTSHKYTLDMKDGERIVLGDSVSGIGAIGEHIREKVAPLVYERCAEALNRGENVDFGPIRLNLTQGIWDRDQLYGWPDIEQVGAGKGYFIVEPKKGSGLRRASVPIGDIPNFDALMTLVAQAMPPKPE